MIRSTSRVRRTVLFLTALVGISTFSGPFALGQTTTLDEAIVRSLALDPTIRKMFSDVTEADGFMREMRSDLMPQLTLEGGAGWANRDRSIDGVATGGEDLFSRQIGLVFEQLLFDSGFHWYRWQDAAERLKGKRLLDVAQREAATFGVVESYLDVIRSRKQIDLARANLEVHGKIRDLAANRAEAAGNQADVELSSARYDLALTMVKERDLAVRQAETRFFRFTGQNPGDLAEPEVPTVGAFSEIDATQNFHYQAALHQREAATLARKAVQSRYSPRFLFRGTGGLGEDVLGIRGRDNEASAMVVVQWDLFESGRKKGFMKQAIADIDRQTAVIDETLVALSQDIESRWEDYSTIAARIAVLNDYADKLNKTVTLYERQFELGTRPLLSTLDIQNEEIGAKIRLTDEQFDFDLTAYRLLFFGGRLITSTVGEDYLETPEDEGEGGDHQMHPWIDSNVDETADYLEPKKKKGFSPFGFLKKPETQPVADVKPVNADNVKPVNADRRSPARGRPKVLPTR